MTTIPEIDSAKSEPSVRCDDGLADLIAEYLACDGSHSMYDMLALMDVRPKIVEIIGVERIIKQRHKRLNQIRSANDGAKRPDGRKLHDSQQPERKLNANQ